MMIRKTQKYCVKIAETEIMLQDAYDFVENPAHGGVDLFVGAVRNNHQGNDVTGITYDVHDALAVKSFEDICSDTLKKWPDTRLYLSHFKGYLDVGGISIIIAVSAPHRAETYDACRFMIEQIKHRSPVWKQEHYIDGPSEWLPGHSLKPEVGIG